MGDKMIFKKSGSQWEVIKKYVSGRKVLDVGCIGFNEEGMEKLISADSWMHEKIRANAQYVLGVDIAEDTVVTLQTRGYNIIHGNVLTMQLEEKFDVIFAGSLFQHLTNFDAFFNNLSRHLNDGGFLVLTVPNVFYLPYLVNLFIGRLRYEDLPVPKVYHKYQYHHQDLITLANLASKYGFQIVEHGYFEHTHKTWKQRLFFFFVRKPFFEKNIIVVLKKLKG